MRPGSDAAAGTATGRPSHHHAAAAAAVVRMNKATRFRMKISMSRGRRLPARQSAPLPSPAREGNRLWQRSVLRRARGRLRLGLSSGRPEAGPVGQSCPRRDGCRMPPCRRDVDANIYVATALHDWTKSATSAIYIKKSGAVIGQTEPSDWAHHCFGQLGQKAIVRPCSL
jgi:hypothetical protein